MEETLDLGFLRHSSGRGLRSSGSEAKERSGLRGGPAPACACCPLCRERGWGGGSPEALLALTSRSIAPGGLL